MIGRVLKGGYKILDEIGRGGFGTVYLAIDVKTEQLWAIKALSLSVVDQVEAQRLRDLFDREQKILSWLSHPAIVRRKEVLTEGSQVFLVMEYVDGEDLRRIVARQSRGLSAGAVASLAEQICEILAYLHAQKPHPIVFRDLKPSNLMLTRGGQIKLIDFGIARLARLAQSEPKEGTVASSAPLPVSSPDAETEILDPESVALAQHFFSPEGSTQDTTCLGTPGYAAPEQYGGRGMRSDARADIYALGVIMFQLVTREDPARLPIPLPSLRDFVVTDDTFEGIVLRATSVDREERFPTARILASALAAYRTRIRYTRGIDEFLTLLGKSRVSMTVSSATAPAVPGAVSPRTPAASRPRPTPPNETPKAGPDRTRLAVAGLALAAVVALLLAFLGR